MAACVCLVLSIIILPLVFLRLVLSSGFSQEELEDMGVCYEKPAALSRKPVRHQAAHSLKPQRQFSV